MGEIMKGSGLDQENAVERAPGVRTEVSEWVGRTYQNCFSKSPFVLENNFFGNDWLGKRVSTGLDLT
jgi:hypothetical protein